MKRFVCIVDDDMIKYLLCNNILITRSFVLYLLVQVMRQKHMKFQNQNKGKKGPRGGGGNNNNMNSNMNMNGHPGGGGGGGPPSSSSLATLEQKHPVSLLGELASKRRWGPPVYELVCEQGPAHAKNFIFKVTRRKQSGHDGTICNSINPFSSVSVCRNRSV